MKSEDLKKVLGFLVAFLVALLAWQATRLIDQLDDNTEAIRALTNKLEAVAGGNPYAQPEEE